MDNDNNDDTSIGLSLGASAHMSSPEWIYLLGNLQNKLSVLHFAIPGTSTKTSVCPKPKEIAKIQRSSSVLARPQSSWQNAHPTTTIITPNSVSLPKKVFGIIQPQI